MRTTYICIDDHYFKITADRTLDKCFTMVKNKAVITGHLKVERVQKGRLPNFKTLVYLSIQDAVEALYRGNKTAPYVYFAKEKEIGISTYEVCLHIDSYL